MTTPYDPSLTLAFAAGFAGVTITPGNPGYDTARSLWNATAEGHPAIIARCHSVADVVAAVNLTRTAGIPLATRGGGHSLAGLSTCDGGVVIDLSALRGVTVRAERRIASVEPGVTWADFDAATAAHGLASTGGLISTTGVAGLTLGGGIGWLQRKYGLACDDLRVAQIVTADGSVIEADGELLWACAAEGATSASSPTLISTCTHCPGSWAGCWRSRSSAAVRCCGPSGSGRWMRPTRRPCSRRS